MVTCVVGISGVIDVVVVGACGVVGYRGVNVEDPLVGDEEVVEISGGSGVGQGSLP